MKCGWNDVIVRKMNQPISDQMSPTHQNTEVKEHPINIGDHVERESTVVQITQKQEKKEETLNKK